MSSKMRKRGWSIHSEGEQSHGTKQSAVTDQSEDTLTDAEKLKLLRNFPSEDSENEEGCQNDVIDMFGSEDEYSKEAAAEVAIVHKRRKVVVDRESSIDSTAVQHDNNGLEKESSVQTPNKEKDEERKRFDAAKGRLSKWAARLFDPNRPRGLVEPPQMIPLNDEFLKAFGKREKEHDDKTGQIIEIDHCNLDELTDDENDEISATNGTTANSIEMESTNEKNCKVKVVNLAYLTKEAAIVKAFEKFGALVEINLVQDPEKKGFSLGRAYVTYEKPDDAEKCVEKLNETCLEGRMIFVSLYHTKTGKKNRRSLDNQNNNAKSTLAKRYWLNDISTKCFRCGEVGHNEANCKNEAKPKPCPLCAQFGHDPRACPFSKICFNCGVPGHINRECPQRRGLPKRIVCGLCYQSGHHRWTCPENLKNINTRFAKCFICAEEGHLMCRPMRWFFGLKGQTCFNCGRADHHGVECDRPTAQICEKNPEVGLKEIEQAAALSLADEVSMQSSRKSHNGDPREHGRNRQSRNERYDNGRQRSKSTPPIPNFHSQNQKSTYGRIHTNQHRGNRIDGALTSERGNQTHTNRGNNNFKRGYGSTRYPSPKRYR